MTEWTNCSEIEIGSAAYFRVKRNSQPLLDPVPFEDIHRGIAQEHVPAEHGRTLDLARRGYLGEVQDDWAMRREQAESFVEHSLKMIRRLSRKTGSLTRSDQGPWSWGDARSRIGGAAAGPSTSAEIGRMTLQPLPPDSRMRWRRLDVPGREEARVERTASGWRLTGELDVEETGVAARLRYAIDCDPDWRTRSALIEGEANGRPLRFALAADGAGNWTRDDSPLPDLAGTLDIDLGFTPATNTLPIRRLSLAVGESAPVRSAWLRFPELRLEPLEQTYTREAEQSFRYRALVDGEPFIARLDTDVFGRVLHYEGLWESE